MIAADAEIRQWRWRRAIRFAVVAEEWVKNAVQGGKGLRAANRIVGWNLHEKV